MSEVGQTFQGELQTLLCQANWLYQWHFWCIGWDYLLSTMSCLYMQLKCALVVSKVKKNGFSSSVSFLGQGANPFRKHTNWYKAAKLQWYKATKNWYKLVLVSIVVGAEGIAVLPYLGLAVSTVFLFLVCLLISRWAGLMFVRWGVLGNQAMPNECHYISSVTPLLSWLQPPLFRWPFCCLG